MAETFDDKPRNMLLKTYLVKRIARNLNKPESIVDRVVMFQFESLVEAMKTGKSVEMSGFGKWVFMEPMARRKADNLTQYIKELKEAGELPRAKNVTIESLNKDIEFMKSKLTNQDHVIQSKTDSGGLEELRDKEG